MRTLLIILIAFVGLTATLLGMLLIAYPVVTAYGLTLEPLQPAVLNSFLLPGVLFVIIGTANLAALYNSMQRARTQYSWPLAASSLTIAWIVIHSAVLRAIPWLYITYFVCSLFIMLLSWQLKGKWAV
jgi:hypothetical protein